MKLTVECECGNMIVMRAPSKKFLQLRDNLETKDFRFDGAEYDNNNKVRGFCIYCNKCKNYIYLGVD